MPYARNPGRLPPECVIRDDDGNATGFRAVHVRLFGGFDSKKRGDAPWPSGAPTVWRISGAGHPFEIEEWEVA